MTPRVPIASGTVRTVVLPLRTTFRISRGAADTATVVRVTLHGPDGCSGVGESVPYARYGETVDGVLQTIETRLERLAGSELCPDQLQTLEPAGAARNALDLALWDLIAKTSRHRVHEHLRLEPPGSVQSVDTIVLDRVDTMRESAATKSSRPILKVKLDGEQIIERVDAVHAAAPNSALLVDANESWTADTLCEVATPLAERGVVMIEQPLPAAEDNELEDLGDELPITLCADESCHTREDLARLANRYGMVNIKLDKTGGLTEAVALAREATTRGFGLMVGCMVSSSLGIAPAQLLASAFDARFIDLDGPTWLRQDHEHGLIREGLLVAPASSALWG